MPQITVYIRKEDINLWKGVVKKSEFMHNALQEFSTYDGAPIVLREQIIPMAPKPIEGAQLKPVGYETPSQKADREMRKEMIDRMNNPLKLG